MKPRKYLAMGVALIGAAAIGVAGWGYAHPAVASAHSDERHAAARLGVQEGHRFRHADRAHDWLEGRRAVDADRDDEFESESESGATVTTSSPTSPTTTPPTTAPTPPTTTAPSTTTTTATPPTTAAPSTTTTTTARPSTTTTAAPSTTTTTAINAAPLFATYCASCHGSGGINISATLTAAQIYAKITTGSMAGHASSLSDAQKQALAAYVASIF